MSETTFKRKNMQQTSSERSFFTQHAVDLTVEPASLPRTQDQTERTTKAHPPVGVEIRGFLRVMLVA